MIQLLIVSVCDVKSEKKIKQINLIVVSIAANSIRHFVFVCFLIFIRLFLMRFLLIREHVYGFRIQNLFGKVQQSLLT